MTDEDILDALETAINNTHEMDVTDADYARACLPVVKAAVAAERDRCALIVERAYWRASLMVLSQDIRKGETE